MWNNQTSGWYALFVATGQEEIIQKYLTKEIGKEMTYIMPTRQLKERRGGRWYEVRRKLFPGYLLLQGIMTEKIYYKIKQTPGLIKVLWDGMEPLQIPEQEMYFYLKMLDSHGNIGVSTLYKEDDKIIVLDGPLKGQEELIEKVITRKGRARVRLYFLGEERTVEIGITVIDKI